MNHTRLILAFAVALCHAQDRTSSIRGDVLDPSGAPVQGAQVTATSLDTGLERKTASDEAGRYVFARLELGSYRVVVRHAGFETATAGPVLLQLDREAALRHRLVLAGSLQNVTVEASAAVVDVSASALSGVVDDRRAVELPLNGRDYLQLVATLPGATVARAQARAAGTGFGIQISLAGSRPVQNNYRLDGISLTNQTGSTPGSVNGVNLGVDSIREFSVLTSSYGAQYGRAAGGVVNAVTQSGTNAFHGAAFYFHRNSAVDARNFFDGAALPAFRRHQFGGSVAGPVARNRTFFFASAEGLAELQGNTTINTTLSDAAREGLLAAGAVTVDANVTPLLRLYPKPNSTLLGDTGLYVFSNNLNAREAFSTARLDHAFSARDTLFARYSFDDALRHDQTNFALSRREYSSRMQSLAVEETHIVSPAVVMATRGGWVRSEVGFGKTAAAPGADQASLAFIPSAVGPGIVSVAGLSDFPGGSGAQDADISDFQSLQLYEDVSALRGSHFLKAGGSIESTRFDFDSRTDELGEFTFPTLSAMLTNQPSRFRAMMPGADSHRVWRQEIFAWYVHDTFRAARRVTLDLSLRHEWITVPRERDGKLSNLVQLTDASLTTGVLFRNPSFRNFAPRVGVAWDVMGNSRTLARAGYGIYHDQLLSQFLLIAGVRNPPFFQLADVRSLAAGGFPSTTWQQVIASPTIDLRIERLDPAPSQPYVQQWNASLQHRVSASLSLLASYAGSHGLRLSTMVEDANLVQPTLLNDGRLYFPADGVKLNSAFGLIRDRLFNGGSFYHSFQSSATTHFGRAFMAQGSYTFAKSIDDDSSSFARTEASNTIGIPVDGIAGFNRGLSNFDVRHTASFNLVWITPRRTALLSDWRLGVLATAASGLPTSVTLAYDAARTGTSRPDYRGGQRPDVNPRFSGNAVTGNPNGWVKASAFLRPTPGFLGNLGRNTIGGPSLVNIDAALSREFALRREGRVRLAVRCEAFNLLNHTNFDLPTSSRLQVFNASSTPEDFGRITSAGPARKFQFGARVSF